MALWMCVWVCIVTIGSYTRPEMPLMMMTMIMLLMPHAGNNIRSLIKN